MEDLEKQGLKRQNEASFRKFHDPVASLPCHFIPLPDNPRFTARENELSFIHESLDHKPTSLQHRECALWGTGGIGKTQLALAYAYERKEDGKVPAILWVNSETQLDIYQSFLEIASMLDLDGASDRSESTNLFVVTKWLLKSSKLNRYLQDLMLLLT